jgi:hypothetical protein
MPTQKKKKKKKNSERVICFNISAKSLNLASVIHTNPPFQFNL